MHFHEESKKRTNRFLLHLCVKQWQTVRESYHVYDENQRWAEYIGIHNLKPSQT